MLSYEQIGAAAMMSRARRRARRRPRRRGAARIRSRGAAGHGETADSRARAPRAARRSEIDDHASVCLHHLVRRSAAAAARRRQPDRAHRTGRRSSGRRDASPPRTSRRRSTCRRSRARRWTGMRSSPRTPAARPATRRARAADRRAHLHRPGSTHRHRLRHVRRNRDRRAAARRRRCGRDGRTDDAPTATTACAITRRAAPGQNIGRRGADIAAGDLVVRRGDVLNPGRVGAVAAIGRAERRRLRAAARRHPLDGQRGGRTRDAARRPARSST